MILWVDRNNEVDRYDNSVSISSDSSSSSSGSKNNNEKTAYILTFT